MKNLKPVQACAWALAAGAMSWSSAAIAEKVTLSGDFPAKYPEASELRRLAVSPFSGDAGGEMTGALRSQLAMGEGASGPWFTIVAELSRRRARGGGSDGVLTGSAQGSVAEMPVERRTFNCIQYQGKKCIQYQTLSCTVRVVSLVVDAKLTRTADSRIVYSSTKPFRDEMEWCAGQAPARTPRDSAMQMALLAARDIKRDISPYTESYVLKIKEDAKGLTKPLKAKFKTAVKLSTRDLQGSCASWEAMKADAAASEALAYNLGICAETRRDYTAAGQYYQQAQSLDPDGSKRTAEATSRIRLLIAARQQAMQQQARRQSSEVAQSRAEAQAERKAQAAAAARASQQRSAQDRARQQQAAQAASARAARDTQRQQVASKYGAAAADAIIARRVQKGMTAAQVQAAIGAPSRRERIGAGEEQWYYPGRRVVFSGGRVSYVGN
ncbi:MAG TPA: hypothetical protein VF619_10780 [Allosphingosinicella sp.]|jgi:hypothetical protein